MDAIEFRNRINENIQDPEEILTDLDFDILLSIYKYQNSKIEDYISDGISQIKQIVPDLEQLEAGGSGKLELIPVELKKGTLGYALKNSTNKNQKNSLIIQGIRNDDQSVIEYLYFTVYPIVQYNISKQRGGDIELAEEVFNNALNIFVNTVKKPKTSISGDVIRYFFGILNNKWIDVFNSENKLFQEKYEYEQIDIDNLENYNISDKTDSKINRNKRVGINIPDDEKGIYGKVEGDSNTLDLIFDFLNSKNEKWADIIYYYYIYGYDQTEIADILGYKNGGSVKTQKSKAMAELKAHCEQFR